MTPLARRAKDRRIKRRRHQLAMLVTRAGQGGRLDDSLSDEEFIERVKERLRQIGWWAPLPARGAKRA